MIQLHDKQFVPFISAKEIEFAITKIAASGDDFIDETRIYRSFKRLFYGGF
jgi:hypoxanthine phosphoribosyltransferase